jgi:hypothetical protein
MQVCVPLLKICMDGIAPAPHEFHPAGRPANQIGPHSRLLLHGPEPAQDNCGGAGTGESRKGASYKLLA